MSETDDPERASDGEPGTAESGKARRRSLLGGILATSKATTAKFQPQAASVGARKCRSCGAGRPEDTDIRGCAYCCDRFMTDDVDPGLDPDAEAADA